MSSGSDGRPKRIRRTHASWISSFRVTLNKANLSSDDSYAIVGRLSHSLALYAAVEAAWIGADIHALASVRPNKQFAAIKKLQSTVLYATPSQLRLLCKEPAAALQANTQVKHIFCGGGKMDSGTFKQLSLHFPNARIQEFYGASETSFISISCDTTTIDSVGKPYPEVELQIMPIDTDLDIVSHNALPYGCTGELWVKSPYLFEHYADGTQGNVRWRQGFLCIGEMGYIDDSAQLYLSGRRSRMVNVADNIVFPEQIESLLNEHRRVRHCAVIPVADAKRGHVLIAIVEATQNSELSTMLLKQCRAQFGTLKAPKKLIFVDHLPMLASGKPDLNTIEKQFASHG